MATYCWSGVMRAVANIARAGKMPSPHRSQYFVQLKTFEAVGWAISGGRAYTALPKAYDTQSDLSQTTCWIRQNLRMSDPVSPPKTPFKTIVYDISDRVL